MVGVVGAVAYLLALVATLPARMVFDPGPREALGGTVWKGEALIAGTHRLEWRWAALRTILGGAFAADWRLTGAGTDLAGNATVRGSHLTLEDVSGEADGALLAVLAPALPFDCVTTMEVRIDRLSLGGERQSGTGRLRSAPGHCTPKQLSVATFAIPALIGTIGPDGDTTDISLAAAASHRPLLRGSLTRAGHLRASLTPAGAQALPFARGFTLDMQL